MSDDRLPIIGITARRFDAGAPFKLESAVAIQADYFDAVTRAGGLAVGLPPDPVTPEEAARRVASLDGLVLSGGGDLDPTSYGQDVAADLFGVSGIQDTYETEMLRAALAAGVPVLAICRGLQIANVAFGGTLHQHITDHDDFDAHGIPNGGGGWTNTFRVEPTSLLAATLGTVEPSGRCHHHQAVDRLGEGLVVTARTDDGGVEGLELADVASWFLAVQWHPEETAATDPANQALFDHLVAAARH